MDLHRSSFLSRLKHAIFGKPKDIHDHSIFHRLSLIPFLAWVGLGADGLSSSAYGPEEAFKTLGEHRYLAIFLVALTGATVMIISAAYRRIIEAFPHGGGGYVVSSKLLGRKLGLISGCALLVDYVLTITVSVAAAGDALFSFIPLSYHPIKIYFEIITLLFLTALNIRGVKESVLILTPIFIAFLITHALLLVFGIFGHAPLMVSTAATMHHDFKSGLASVGGIALFLQFIHAYSLGGGTYTGIEAVSNGLQIMREPKVKTAQRTMTYMAVSLAITASGLILCYLLWNTNPVEGQTLNAVLFSQISSRFGLGTTFVILSLFAEGLLLVVAAQAGFIDGPRVLANMAVDSWVPRRFAALSERLTTANGIVLMGLTALIALILTRGDVGHLVVMYSINVFLTFSLSILGMLIMHLKQGRQKSGWRRSVMVFASGFVLCFTILVFTVFEKFTEGGWITLLVTTALVFLCVFIKQHYLDVAKSLHKLSITLERMKPRTRPHDPLNHSARTAAVLVGGYGGLGIHTVQTLLRTFPGVYKNLVFISIGVVDSDGFKGEEALEHLKHSTEAMLSKYAKLGEELGLASTYRYSLGTDIVQEGETICLELVKEFKNTTFFTGKIIFENENWLHRLLHNETGFALQKRLQLAGQTMVILPAKIAG